MEVELVTVGTELLLGFTVDTNAAEIARALAAVGGRVTRHATVPDEPTAVRSAVDEALGRSRFVVVTGGLGPTSDDLTKPAVAEIFGMSLELDETYLRRLEERFHQIRHRAMPPSNRSQAEVPRGATILPNARGTAPGLVLEGPIGTAVLLPGVPGEMRQLLHEHVVPLVRERVAASGRAVTIRSRTLRTTGITESGLADLLAPLEPGLEGVSIAYLPGWDGTDLRITTWDAAEVEAERTLAVADRRLLEAVGTYCYGEGEEDLAAVVLDALRGRGRSLAVAESCTGGLVGARLSAIPGASEVFLGGVIAYSNAAKIRDLEVPEALIETEGAVSEATARAMAAGASSRFAAAAALSVTGIAGPGGGTPAKPVGTVWMAAVADGRVAVQHRRFLGGRDEVRHRSAQAALDLLRQLLLRLQQQEQEPTPAS